MLSPASGHVWTVMIRAAHSTSVTTVNNLNPALFLPSLLFLNVQVSLVSQEPVLFARTVEENITYGLSDTPVVAVMEAAVQANAHDFISELPKGYQTSN